MTTEYLIVGAGPSGCAAGITLRKHGKECVIIERYPLGRRKLCAGVFTRKSQRALDELLGAETAVKCYGECLVSREKQLVLWKDMEKLVACDTRFPITLIDRPKFDYFLAKHFMEQGGTILDNTNIVSISFDDRTVTLENGEKITYKNLIAADGANSFVEREAKKQVVGFLPKDESILAMEINVDREDFSIDGVNLYFEIVPETYAWAFSKDDKVCLGLGKLQGKDFSAQEVFTQFLKKLGVKNLDKYPLRGAMLPFGNTMPVPAIPSADVMFVGDAGGLVEPVTGEGIFCALQSGIFAGDSRNAEEYLEKVKFLYRLIKKDAGYQKLLTMPRMMKFFYHRVKDNPGFMEHFYSTQIEEVCFEKFIQIYLKYKLLYRRKKDKS